MYEKILAAICTATIVIGTIWFVCRRDSNRRTGDGDGRNVDPVRGGIESAGRDAHAAADDNRRAREDNQQAQQLVQKAKSILGSAKHTNSNS
jgi:hypothetical protein